MIPPHERLICLGICAALIATPGSNDAAAVRVRHGLGDPTARRWLNRGAGLTMIGAALGIAVSG